MSEIDRSVLLDVALLDSEQSLMWFSAVHLLAMTTVVSNPILYGWLNTNLKHLFRAMIPLVNKDRNRNNGNGGGLGETSMPNPSGSPELTTQNNHNNPGR